MAHNHYKQFDLGTLGDWARSLPSDTVVHLDPSPISYRGYYEHVSFDAGETTAGVLADNIDESIGQIMTGYKGGDFPITSDCLVFLAGYGDTGPMLVGFTEDYYPITVAESWIW